MKVLSLRESVIPAENLNRWLSWGSRIEKALRPDHRDTLTTRSKIAQWTGNAGDPRESLRLFRALLPDRTRVLGADDPDTIATRSTVAYWTGIVRGAHEALRLSQEVLTDQMRVLGPNHPATLRARNNVAYWTGGIGHAQEALQLSQELLSDQTEVLGPGNSDTLRTRNNIAGWTAEVGDLREALHLSQELLPDQIRWRMRGIWWCPLDKMTISRFSTNWIGLPLRNLHRGDDTMDFPIIDLLDEAACYAQLVTWIHPEGLACPDCHRSDHLRIHRRGREPVINYRCGQCGRVFNAFTGTALRASATAPARSS